MGGNLPKGELVKGHMIYFVVTTLLKKKVAFFLLFIPLLIPFKNKL